MDGSRFDQWAKDLVTRTDRRRVLLGVSGVVATILGESFADTDPLSAKEMRTREAGKQWAQDKSGQAPAEGGKAGKDRHRKLHR